MLSLLGIQSRDNTWSLEAPFDYSRLVRGRKIVLIGGGNLPAKKDAFSQMLSALGANAVEFIDPFEDYGKVEDTAGSSDMSQLVLLYTPATSHKVTNTLTANRVRFQPFEHLNINLFLREVFAKQTNLLIH